MKKISAFILLTLVWSFTLHVQTKAKNVEADKTNITMRLDYAGAEAIIDALGKDSLIDSDVDDLLRIHGVRAMVDNVTNYFPQFGVAEFRDEVKTFAQTKKSGPGSRYFQLHLVWRTREHVRSVIKAIKADEKEIVRQALDQLKRYSPNAGRLTVNVYFVGGGVSDGFVFDKREEPAFYINLSSTDGTLVDYNGVIANMAHEAYHVLQKTAQRRAGLEAIADAADKLPSAERLLAVLLSEGTANYAIDPTRSNAAGADMEKSRERYRRNAEPERVKENFALFDSVLSDLREGRTTWNEAYKKGFSGNNDARFYFVGYEMAKSIEKHHGSKHIGKVFGKRPVEFFRQYIALYKKHPEITARFSPETEAYIASLR